MALSESVVSELLDAFRAGDGVDLIRDAVQLVLQELIEVEATEQIGAARYERADTRITERNGARPRLLTTQAGDVELRIPKLRKGLLPEHLGAAPSLTELPGGVKGYAKTTPGGRAEAPHTIALTPVASRRCHELPHGPGGLGPSLHLGAATGLAVASPNRRS